MAPASIRITEEGSSKVVFSDDDVEMVLDRTIKFGKYKTEDRKIGWIVEKDPNYFVWLANKMVEDGLGETKTCKIYAHLINERVPIDHTMELLTYGQYRGKTYKWLLTNKTSYFMWLLDQKRQIRPYANETRYMESLMKKH